MANLQATKPIQLYFHRKLLDMTLFGELRRSDDIVENVPALRERMKADGYLFLPGLLDRDEVLSARREIFKRIADKGGIDLDYPLEKGVIKNPFPAISRSEILGENLPLDQVIHQGPMIQFYERFLGGPVRYFDHTWFRACTNDIGASTKPHYDIVYMGRGTQNLYTTWTPYGDYRKDEGVLMVIENSHRHEQTRNTYGTLDVDTFCLNQDDSTAMENYRKRLNYHTDGAFADSPQTAQAEIGGRFLTADFKAGDVLIFGMYTMHASIDNTSHKLRISTDTRYQLASDPIDERWVGEHPSGHGGKNRKGLIC